MPSSVAFLIGLVVGLGAPCVLGVATAHLLVRKRDQPKLWLLTPLFVLLWLAIGSGPIAILQSVRNAKAEREQVRVVAEELRAAKAVAARTGIAARPLTERQGAASSSRLSGTSPTSDSRTASRQE